MSLQFILDGNLGNPGVIIGSPPFACKEKLQVCAFSDLYFLAF